MTTSSYDRLLKLAHQRAIDGKGGLAASIAKMCLDSRADLNEEELQLTFEILRQLIDKVEVQIRRYIADYLAERSDVPHDLVTYLANDVVNVAYPVLVHSVQLTDQDLIEIIKNQGAGHQLAVAKRGRLSGEVSESLIKSGTLEVLQQVFKNEMATINENGFVRATVRSMSEHELQGVILRRRDLPLSVPAVMYGFVGAALRDHISNNFKISLAKLDDATGSAIDRLMTEKRAAISWSDAEGRDHDQRLLGAVESGGLSSLVGVLARLMGTENDDIQTMLKQDEPNSLATVLRAFGVSRDQFIGFLQRL